MTHAITVYRAVEAGQRFEDAPNSRARIEAQRLDEF
jgi:hypothetical protein